MRLNSRPGRLFFTLSIAFAGACLSPVQAKTPYDGPWAVTIMTHSGTCDAAYRYAVSVSDGNIIADARESSGVVAISGKIDGSGQVKVSLGRGEQHASATGKLSANGGTGTWSGKSSSSACSGSWEAKRN
jgi:hypothetical protein